MLSEIQAFGDSEVYCVVLPDEPEKTRYWFRATEVSKFLGYSDTFRAVHSHCKDWQYREFQVGKGRPALYICESGVYRLILRSKSSFAQEFQDWLTEVMLPKLRASGSYTAEPEDQQHFQPFELKIQLQETQAAAIARLEACLQNSESHEMVNAVVNAIDVTRKVLADIPEPFPKPSPEPVSVPNLPSVDLTWQDYFYQPILQRIQFLQKAKKLATDREISRGKAFQTKLPMSQLREKLAELKSANFIQFNEHTKGWELVPASSPW